MALKKKKTTEETIENADKEADAALAAAVEAKEGEAKAEPKVKLPKYKVTEVWHGSIGGSITTMAKGKIIDPHSYGGMPGIEMLKKSGLQLEKA
ncbi:hypothetical protein LCGC14_3084000 [marine sediment metagenome]|uniref:Uncharacterized protein n=1 Tax=marine sediment metagenome TaxID=412755 RepID=A0A0F8WDB8_9ZZZZ